MSIIPPTGPSIVNPSSTPEVQPSQQGQAGIPGSPPEATWVHSAEDVPKASGDPANHDHNADGTSTAEKLAEESALPAPKPTPSTAPQRGNRGT